MCYLSIQQHIEVAWENCAWENSCVKFSVALEELWSCLRK